MKSTMKKRRRKDERAAEHVVAYFQIDIFEQWCVEETCAYAKRSH